METYDERGEIENEGVWFQLKATDNLRVIVKRKAIAVRMEWRDLLFWLNERMPGILVDDAIQDKAWWLHLQEAIRGLQRKKAGGLASTATLHVPLTNVLNDTAIQRFAELRDAAMAQKTEEQK